METCSHWLAAPGCRLVSGSTGEFRARYVWDGQDSPTVPSRGSRVISTLSRVLQSPGLPHPIAQLDLQTSTFIPTGPKTSIFFWRPAAPPFEATQGRFNSSRSAEPSGSAPIFRRSFSATTMPIRPWASGAKSIACHSSSEEESTGADGTRPAPPSTIRAPSRSGARLISACSPTHL